MVKYDANPPGLILTPALGETLVFQPGQRVLVMERFPLGHYRVPLYLYERSGVVESLVQSAIDNEEEGFGLKRHHYRIGVALSDTWTDYAGAKQDRLYDEAFRFWPPC